MRLKDFICLGGVFFSSLFTIATGCLASDGVYLCYGPGDTTVDFVDQWGGTVTNFAHGTWTAGYSSEAVWGVDGHLYYNMHKVVKQIDLHRATKNFADVSSKYADYLVGSKSGSLYFYGFYDNTLNRLTLDGIVQLVANVGQNYVRALAVDANENLYYVQGFNPTALNVVTPSGVISNVIPDLAKLQGFGTASDGDAWIGGMAVDNCGAIYISDWTSINRIDQAGAITKYADGFNCAASIAFDSAGNLYVADCGALGSLWRISKDRSMTKLASYSYPTYVTVGPDPRGDYVAPPVIVRQPLSQVGYWGQSVTLSAQISGATPMDLQWARNGIPIVGATNSSLVLSDLKLTDGGEYRLSATNSVGWVTSKPATLTINPAGLSLGLYSGIMINGVVGRSYAISYKTNLSETAVPWTALTNITLTASPQLWIDSSVNVSAQPSRYYRADAVQ